VLQRYEGLLKLFLNHLETYKTGLTKLSPKELYEPENYILSFGGKRVRPLLALMACDAYDKDPSLALNAALSVELFHNFSLIHDDILDAAPLRRNQATVHTKWNTNIAILSGDVMLVKAYDVLQNENPIVLAELMRVFTRTAIEVCEGQQWDMNFETQTEVSVEQYIHMITNKTAVLLGCSLQMGAICAGAPVKEQQAIYEFGKHLGLAFQLLDDLLDAYTDNPNQFGKQIGGDILANKKTFLLLKAFELANANQFENLTKALELPASSGEIKIKHVKTIFDELGIKNLVQQEADKHTHIAITCLDALSIHADKKQNLTQFAYDLLNRTV
jgi:geranylgeranyl diphosphate synthase, type II